MLKLKRNVKKAILSPSRMFTGFSAGETSKVNAPQLTKLGVKMIGYLGLIGNEIMSRESHSFMKEEHGHTHGTNVFENMNADFFLLMSSLFQIDLTGSGTLFCDLTLDNDAGEKSNYSTLETELNAHFHVLLKDDAFLQSFNVTYQMIANNSVSAKNTEIVKKLAKDTMDFIFPDENYLHEAVKAVFFKDPNSVMVNFAKHSILDLISTSILNKILILLNEDKDNEFKISDNQLYLILNLSRYNDSGSTEAEEKIPKKSKRLSMIKDRIKFMSPPKAEGDFLLKLEKGADKDATVMLKRRGSF